VTLIINVVKLFDLIFVMTEGGPANASRTIAFTMYNEALASRNFDYGAAIAVVMLVVLIPVMVFNVSRFRADRVVQ
jgi:ABC-type sugar transport system permease subunit